MPLLTRGSTAPKLKREIDPFLENAGPKGVLHGARKEPATVFRAGLLETCANQGCRSSWLQLWRSRSVPVFEEGWNCSAECTEARMLAAVVRELEGRIATGEVHRHRVPLGLLMLEQGWITPAQLRKALDAQRQTGKGRLGYWLVRQGSVTEPMVTRALGLQWSCPVLTLDHHDAVGLGAVMPRLFVEAFGALPLRLAAGRLLYLGFEAALDPVLALAIERMSGLRVESGVVRESQFRPAHAAMLKTEFPAVEIVEAVSEMAAAHALARAVERTRPAASRLVRVYDWLWLRMWLHPQAGPLPERRAVQDLVCSIGGL